MHRSILVAALLTILLTATPAPAQTTLSPPSDVPIGGVTEDGFVRAASDVFVECGPAEPVFVQQYAGACAEAGFPILDARSSSEPSVSAGTPSEPAARESAGGPTSHGSSGAPPSLPDTGGAPLLLIAGLLLAGVGLVAHRSTR